MAVAWPMARLVRRRPMRALAPAARYIVPVPRVPAAGARCRLVHLPPLPHPAPADLANGGVVVPAFP